MLQTFQQWWHNVRLPSVGSRGENDACRYLRTQGFRILKRNIFNPKGRRLGEIDILAEQNKTLVFVEVKARSVQSKTAEVFPEMAIRREKLARMRKIAEWYVKKRGWLERPYRFDAVAIVYRNGFQDPEIRHLPDIYLT